MIKTIKTAVFRLFNRQPKEKHDLSYYKAETEYLIREQKRVEEEAYNTLTAKEYKELSLYTRNVKNIVYGINYWY